MNPPGHARSRCDSLGLDCFLVHDCIEFASIDRRKPPKTVISVISVGHQVYIYMAHHATGVIVSLNHLVATTIKMLCVDDVIVLGLAVIVMWMVNEMNESRPCPTPTENPRKRRRKRKNEPAKRQRPWISAYLEKRVMYGFYDNLLQELRDQNPLLFRNFLRINSKVFDEMVTELTPLLEKKHTFLREPIPVGLKVAVTLRVLATGESFQSAHYGFRVSPSAISRFFFKVCKAITKVYTPQYLSLPKTTEEWLKIAEDNYRMWNYPHCVGSIDGRHIAIAHPTRAGSMFFNYKSFHSIILLAIVDAHYRFIYVSIGAEGSAGDAGTWMRTNFHKEIEQNSVPLPPPQNLPHETEVKIPYHFIGDNAFGLKTSMMTPYCHDTQNKAARNFNYRLSRCRRVVENAFGLLVQRFRIMGKAMAFTPEKCSDVTMTCCVMHNLCLVRFPPRAKYLDRYNEDGALIKGKWREGIKKLVKIQKITKNPTTMAKNQRTTLATYFMGAGQVPWQWKQFGMKEDKFEGSSQSDVSVM